MTKDCASHPAVDDALAVWAQRVHAVGVHRSVQNARALAGALEAQVVLQKSRPRAVRALQLGLPPGQRCRSIQALAYSLPAAANFA